MDRQKKDGPDILEMGGGVRVIEDVLTAYGIDTREGKVCFVPAQRLAFDASSHHSFCL